MNSNIQVLREKVKKQIDTADENVLAAVRAMLEEDTTSDWWSILPDGVKNDLKESISQADREQIITHEEINKRFPQWHLE